MKKRYILIVASIIMTVAYLDMVDSCKEIDNTISDVVEIDKAKETKIEKAKKDFFNMLKNQNSNIKSSTGSTVFE